MEFATKIWKVSYFYTEVIHGGSVRVSIVLACQEFIVSLIETLMDTYNNMKNLH